MFPKGKKGSPPHTMEELLQTVADTRLEQIQYLSDEIIGMVLSVCYENGFEGVDEDENHKFIMLTHEAIKSMLCASLDIFHPLQNVSFTIVDGEGNVIETNLDDEANDNELPPDGDIA
jgi:hypothetical protein